MTPGPKSSKKVAQKKRGIGSLAALLTAVAVSSFAVLVGTHVLKNVHDTSSSSELKAQIDISHLLAIQTVSSPSFPTLIKTSLLTAQERLCLSGEGSGCSTGNLRVLNLPQYSSLNTDFGPGGENCSSGACSMRRTTRFRLRCVSTNVCTVVEIDLRTEALGRYARSVPSRNSQIQLSSSLFEDRTGFDFACGDTASLTGLDLVDRRGLCEAIPIEDCSPGLLLENASSDTTSNCLPVSPQNCDSAVQYVNSISLAGSSCATSAAAHTAYYWGPWINGASYCSRNCGGGQYLRTDTRQCLRHSNTAHLNGSVVAPALCAGLDGGQASRSVPGGACNTHACCTNQVYFVDSGCGGFGDWWFASACPGGTMSSHDCYCGWDCDPTCTSGDRRCRGTCTRPVCQTP